MLVLSARSFLLHVALLMYMLLLMQFLYMKLLAQWLQVYSTGADGAATLERTARPASSFLPFHSAHLRAACLCIKIIMLFSITAILFSRFLQQPLSCPFTQPICGAQLPASRLSWCGLWALLLWPIKAFFQSTIPTSCRNQELRN